jgi:hypothetical protein
MPTTRSPHLFYAFTLVAAFFAAPLVAQQPRESTAARGDIQTALASDVGRLSDKFVGLARVMAAKYEWRPGQGVRSVGEVFNLIITENNMLSGLLTGASPQGGTAPITDPAKAQDALRTSYVALRQALAALSSSDLQATVKLFGQDTTKQEAAFMLIFDQHEHLGQSIAYARANSVVPPWSK